MRKPFNTTCDLFTGPTATPPDTYIGSFPCRLVFQDGINTTLIAGAEPTLPYWLTIEGHCPRGMFTTPGVLLDTGLGERVAVPQGSAVRFAVLYTDRIVWKDQTPYWRAYLMVLPVPTPLQGGVICGGSAVLTPPPVVTLGGVQCGGQGQVIYVTLGGGVLLGGVAHVVPGSVYLPIGGGLVGGLAHVVPGSVYLPIGGGLLGGLAHVVPGSTFEPSGGVLLGGAASVVPPAPIPTLGGVLLGGAASVVFIPAGTYVLDTYTSPNGTNPTSRACDTGQVPTASGGGYDIQTHHCQNPGNTSYTNPLIYDAGAADVTVQADLLIHQQAQNGDPHYDGSNLVMRWVSDNQYFMVQPYMNTVRIVLWNFGFSIVATYSHTLFDDVVYTLKAVMSGNTFSIYIDGTFLGSFMDSTFSTATKHGIIVKSDLGGGSSYVDNFMVTT